MSGEQCIVEIGEQSASNASGGARFEVLLVSPGSADDSDVLGALLEARSHACASATP